MENERKKFTESSLKEYDGKDRPAYVAYKGKVYDVSDSSLWVEGTHMGIHSAGKDLTEKLVNAPHDKSVFSRFPAVGEFAEEQERKSLGQVIRRMAPHPMITHFPIAYGALIPILSILFLFTGDASFEAASYYVLVFGFLATPVCALSGFISWKVAYDGKKTGDFMKKIAFSIGLFIAATICVVWRTVDPFVLLAGDWFSYLYVLMQLCIALFVSLLGHTGGKIVFS